MEHGISPGPLQPPVFETDFGGIGVQICYDSLAWMNKHYVVSSTRFEHPTKIVDPLGQDIVATGRAGAWVCAPINLDVAVVQGVVNFAKFRDIRKKHGRSFGFRILHVEALATIEARSGDVSVPEVQREFDIPTSKEWIAASKRAQDSKRPA